MPGFNLTPCISPCTQYTALIAFLLILSSPKYSANLFTSNCFLRFSPGSGCPARPFLCCGHFCEADDRVCLKFDFPTLLFCLRQSRLFCYFFLSMRPRPGVNFLSPQKASPFLVLALGSRPSSPVPSWVFQNVRSSSPHIGIILPSLRVSTRPVPSNAVQVYLPLGQFYVNVN